MATIFVTDKAISLCAVKARNASDLTREEIKALTYWCDCQTKSLWDDLTLQEILNVYRVSAEWMTWEDWLDEERIKAVRGWNRATFPKNHMQLMRAAKEI
jgi:hypothetical protein